MFLLKTNDEFDSSKNLRINKKVRKAFVMNSELIRLNCSVIEFFKDCGSSGF